MKILKLDKTVGQNTGQKLIEIISLASAVSSLLCKSRKSLKKTVNGAPTNTAFLVGNQKFQKMVSLSVIRGGSMCVVTSFSVNVCGSESLLDNKRPINAPAAL